MLPRGRAVPGARAERGAAWTRGPQGFTRQEDVLVEIEIGENDRLDWALKQFRRRMIRSGLFKDMRRKRFYEKPSEARKAKSKAAQRRRHKDRKAARRMAQF
jgi:small subunit ribosomal protein S21